MFNQLKKIFFNLSARVTGNIISKILGFVTLPFISRAIGPEGYGDYNLIITLVSYIAILVNWGYSPYGIRETAKTVNTTSIVNDIISTRFTFGIITIALVAFVLYFFLNDNIELYYNILIGFGLIISQVFNLDYYFFGKKKLLIPTISQLTGQIVFVAGVVLYIRTINDLRFLLILYVMYQILTSFLMFGIYVAKNTIKIHFSLKTSLQTIKKTFKLGASARIEHLSSSYPILIIPLFFTSNYELGLYTSAFKFFTIILIVYQTLMITIAPYIVDLKKKSIIIQRRTISQLLGLLLSLGILSSIFFLYTGEFVIELLFGKSFGDAAPLVDLICYYLLPFWPITMVLGTILIYYEYDKYYLKSTIVYAILIIILTPILVHVLGIGGAIHAIGISNFGTITTIVFFLIKLEPEIFKLKKKA